MLNMSALSPEIISGMRRDANFRLGVQTVTELIREEI